MLANISLNNLPSICFLRVFFINLLVHIHLNRMELPKERIDISLKQHAVYFFIIRFPFIFGGMQFLLLVFLLTGCLLLSYIIKVPILFCFLNRISFVSFFVFSVVLFYS